MAVKDERAMLIKKFTENDPVDPEIAEQVEAIVDRWRFDLTINSVTLSAMAEGMTPVVTRYEDTAFVTLDKFGIPLLGVNPEFVLSIVTNGQFVLAHEMMHLLMRHLNSSDEVEQKDPLFVYACEVAINFLVSVLLGVDVTSGSRSKITRCALPTVRNPRTGKEEPTGVDPDAVYRKVRLALRKQGITAPPIEEMFASDVSTVTWLRKAEITPPKQPQCPHMQAGQDGQDGQSGGPNGPQQPGQNDQNGQAGAGKSQKSKGGKSKKGTGSGNPRPEIDPAGLEELVRHAIDRARVAASGSDREAQNVRNELEQLAELTGSEEAAEIWGSMGLGRLRGQLPDAVKKSDFWGDRVAHMIHKRLTEDFKLMVLRNVIDETRFAFRGDREYLKGHLYMDASGSVYDTVLNTIARMCDATEDLVLNSHSFDTEVYPHTIGESFRGGGGTSFHCIDEHVRTGAMGAEGECPCESPDDAPDFVLVVTDGYAPPVLPENHEIYVWIGVPGANLDWAEEMGMDVVRLSKEDLAGLIAA